MNDPQRPWLRSRRALALGALAALVLGAVVAQAALSSGGRKPPARPLDVAVHNALSAPPVAGVTARVRFTNRLIDASALTEGRASPLLSGASGRAWLSADGRFRIELQSSNGDAQIVFDGRQVVAYDASSNTLYRMTLPAQHAARAKAARSERPPTLAEVRRRLREASSHWTLSGAQPSSIAGHPAYTLTVSPQHDGGLLGSASLAWDAAHGVPLRIALRAQGRSQPVLELAATKIDYDKLDASALTPPNPPGAKVVRITPQRQADGRDHGAKVRGLAAVQARVPFRIAAPTTLVGLPRQDVWLIEGERSSPGALVTYGQGLGGLVVFERVAEPATAGSDRHERQLPQLSIGGATATELPSALGTALSWQRAGVQTTLAGSLPRQAAEVAARELAG